MSQRAGAAECRFCRRWEPAPDDAFCSACGSLLLLLEVSPPSLVLISHIAPAKELTLRNDSNRPMQVSIGPRSTPVPGLTLSPVTLQVPANGSAQVSVAISTQALPPGFQRVADYVCVVDGNPRQQRAFKLDIRSGPSPKLLTSKLDFDDVEEGKSVELPLLLANTGGIMLRIKNVRAEGSPHLCVRGDYAGRLLKQGEKLSIPVCWQTTAPESTTVAADVPTGIRIDFANHPDVLFVPATAKMFRYRLAVKPPSVRLPQALAKREYATPIRIENHGTTDIEITSIEADRPWIHVVARATNLTLLCADSAGKKPLSPTTFARAFDFKIVCRPKDLSDGKHQGTVTIQSHGQAPVVVPVEIHLVSPKDYHEYIGIDFGTTNSVVAVLNQRKQNAIELVRDELSNKELIPSVLVFDDPDTYKIGEAAKKEAGVAPDRTVRSIKRVMGYERDRSFFDRSYSAGELASLIIRRLIDLAEEKLHADSGNGAHYVVRKAIITVPANFHDLQIRDVLQACRKAGLETEDERSERAGASDQSRVGELVNAGIILDEPSAAVLYYVDFLRRTRSAADITKAIAREQGLKLMVFDYGGGTLDVSIAGVTHVKGGGTGLRILANMGDNTIGGDTIDVLIMNELLRRCAQQLESFEFDASLISSNLPELERRRDSEGWSPAVWRQVLTVRAQWKDLAENAKIAIAERKQTPIDILPQFLVRIQQGSIEAAPRVVKIDKLPDDAIDGLLRPVLVKCEQVVNAALGLANIAAADIDYILHTGRQSLLPNIRKCVRAMFPKLGADRDLLEQDHLKVCVAKGAALYGAMRDRLMPPDARIFFLSEGRRLPHAYGVETYTNPFEPEFDEVIARGSSYPVEKTKAYPPDMIPTSGYLNLKFYQNTSAAKSIVGNPHVSLVGQISIDTAADGKSGVDVKFAVGANRTLHVFADGKPVHIEPARLQEEESWMG